MYNPEETLKQIAEAIACNADGVRRAFGAWLASGCKRQEELALRAELTAQASGFEPTAQNGATFEGRRRAAAAALAAWEGIGEGVYHETLGVRANREVWAALGVTVYSTGDLGPLTPEARELVLLGMEATGSRGQGALVWALGERVRRKEAGAARHAEAELSRAMLEIASVLQSESAEALVRRLPERIRPLAAAVLADRRGGG